MTSVTELSSSGSVLLKFVMAPVLLVLYAFFGFLVSLVVLRPGLTNNTVLLELVVVGVWLGSSVWIFASLVPLKCVGVRNSCLVVSNFVRTIEVPLQEVQSISDSVIVGPELVWIEFKHPTEFGLKIQFMAKWRIIPWWRWDTCHPVVAHLRGLVAESCEKPSNLPPQSSSNPTTSS